MNNNNQETNMNNNNNNEMNNNNSIINQHANAPQLFEANFEIPTFLYPFLKHALDVRLQQILLNSQTVREKKKKRQKETNMNKTNKQTYNFSLILDRINGKI